MNTYALTWAPTGQTIAEGVQAMTPRAAVRKAPAPYKRFLGEIYATQTSGPRGADSHPVATFKVGPL